jgi:carboxymethylenebutenolidase
MRVTYDTVDVSTPDGVRIRCAVHAPAGAAGARWPGVVAFSDIFQLTGTHLRTCARLASHGFVVVSPEIFGRVLPAGRALDFDADRQLALDTTERMTVDAFDADRRVVLAWMGAHPAIDAARLVACGWCIGGHLAFRAAQEPAIRATACFYATGLHTDTVGGAHGTATSLAGAAAIHGALLLVWGLRDPHIPKDGRATVHRALAGAGVDFQVRIYDAEHTFMRDEGARADPAATDSAFAAMLEVFRSVA